MQKKKRPITTTWYVKLILLIFVAGVIYLTVKSFMDGVKEGREMKFKKEAEQQAKPHWERIIYLLAVKMSIR